MSAPAARAPHREAGPGEPLIELREIGKRYGDLVANDGVTLSVAAGEVVAMLGENGAGKSTLMKIVYGLVRADSGTIWMGGRELAISSPRDAMAAGIGMVTQEFSLVETMTVTENVALSGIGLGRVDLRAARRRVVAAMERIGVSLDPDALVSTLSIGERQRVEIVKALFHDCRVLILDEPTAVLVPQDVRALFTTVERLRAAGLGVLFVSHKLREVAEISDRVVVLRKGRLVATRRTADVDVTTLAALMMGIAGDAPPPSTEAATAVGLPTEATPTAPAEPTPAAPVRPAGSAEAEPVLQLSGLSAQRGGRTVLDGVDLVVRPGEIVGIAGISGNGQTELMDVLCAVQAPSQGTICVAGTDVTRLGSGARLAAGLGRLTEDRKGSVVPTMSVADNLVLEDLAAYTRRGLLDRPAVRAHAEEMIERFAIRAKPGDAIGTLSGGNVQKVLLARALARRPRVLVVAQPTRGLDVGAYRYVHTQLQQLRSSGAGVVVISEDLDEITSLCDRIAVLFRGQVVGELSGADATPERLGLMMAGEAVHVMSERSDVGTTS
ncbi:ABC transporter ATP-binding protein [Rhodococcus sp. X156]|uniref:ABC transporter ATP-binding protein n=1 Tax=Rhodococcus sp. X156 TaxID=2499145 RepID=UPI000FD7E227|nr:ABC transporter ATP-binding protein [Rhodococcus sp. X156]